MKLTKRVPSVMYGYYEIETNSLEEMKQIALEVDELVDQDKQQAASQLTEMKKGWDPMRNIKK